MSPSILEGGSYLAADAARLVGVPGDRIGQWSRWGHIAASVSSREPHVYGWGDVAEALAVHVLLDGGVALPVIRRAVEVLGGPAAWPLTTAGVHLVGGRVAVERGGGLEDVFSEQRILAGRGDVRRRAVDGEPAAPGRRSRADGAEVGEVWTAVDAAGRLARGGWTSSDVVVVDPARVGGRPCVRGTRVAVADLASDPEQDLGLDPPVHAAAIAWWEASWPGGGSAAPGPGPRLRLPRVPATRRGGSTDLVVDMGLPPALAAELRARGRAAHTIPRALADADVAALDGVVITTDRATWALCPRAALVPPGAAGRDVVHRHAHELAVLRGRRAYR